MKKLGLFVAALFAVVIFSTASLADQRFVANLSAAQEVPANNSAGTGVCSISLNAAETQINVSCNYSNLSGLVNAADIHGNAAPGQTANILFNFNFTGSTSGAFNGTFNVTPAQVADLRANRWYVNIHTANFPNGEIRGQIKTYLKSIFDIDGDSRSDINVYRPGDNTFYHLRSTNNQLQAFRFGQIGDFTTTADFDGDGVDDYVAARLNFFNGQVTWYIWQSSTNSLRAQQWGNLLLEDFPALGDYDNDGKLDFGVFRESTGIWYILQSSNNSLRTESFGTTGDTPVPGDYDRDGRTDFAVVRVESGQQVWYVRRSSNNQITRTVFGLSTDTVIPQLPVDVDGDGAQDLLVYRGVNGLLFWYALRSSDNQLFALQWGTDADDALIGDFDGDSKTDFAAIRNENNQLVWYIYQSSNGQLRRVPFGTTGDIAGGISNR